MSTKFFPGEGTAYWEIFCSILRAPPSIIDWLLIIMCSVNYVNAIWISCIGLLGILILWVMMVNQWSQRNKISLLKPQKSYSRVRWDKKPTPCAKFYCKVGKRCLCSYMLMLIIFYNLQYIFLFTHFAIWLKNFSQVHYPERVSFITEKPTQKIAIH